MIIEAVKISIHTKIKIYNKHGITMEEIENVLLEDKPYFTRTKLGRYIALGKGSRYVTIAFNYSPKTKEAKIVTAHPSSKWQIKLYKRKQS